MDSMVLMRMLPKFEQIHAWLYWTAYTELAMPIRAQLSSLIFAKAMCRKNVKGPSRTDIKAKEPTASDASADDGSNASLADDEAAAKC
jgi:hypothetical protein